MQKLDKDNQLAKRNLKPTAMRELVLDALIQQEAAISLPDLEKLFDKVDRVTLYRTLKTFEENKLIHSIDDGSGSVKYALCHEACDCRPEDLHVHFYCTQCHHTFCLHHIPVPMVNMPKGFEMQSVNMVVKGICLKCNS